MPKFINEIHKTCPQYCYVGDVCFCHIPGEVRIKSSRPKELNRLIFINKGKMKIEFANKQSITLIPGDIFIPKSEIRYITSYNCDDYGVFFNNLNDHLTQLPLFNLNKPFNLNPTTIKKIIPYFEKLLSEIQFQEFGYALALNINFMQIVLTLSRAYNHDSNSLDSLDNSKIKPALLEMKNNYNQTHPLSYYANLCHMSLSSFQHVFTQTMNCSPIKHLNNLKLSNACTLLAESTLTISEISDFLGFSSPSYFSNFFKKTYNVSPAAYRINKTEQS